MGGPICGQDGMAAAVLPLVLIALLAATYLHMARWQTRLRKRRWSQWCTASFLSGCAVLAWALVPEALPFAPGDLRQHMVQHVLLGMLGPLGLVMGAPITLLLRALPASGGRLIASVLRGGPVRLVTHPVSALVLNLGGMAALYFTPLYTVAMTTPVLQSWLAFHFVAAGCLYAWVIAGPDPAPHRLSVPARLIVLGVAVVGHSVLSQLLYAGIGTRLPVPFVERQQAAELMYYLGDVTEMLLAVALVSTWRPGSGRPQAVPERRDALPA
jgi:putative membrane protein